MQSLVHFIKNITNHNVYINRRAQAYRVGSALHIEFEDRAQCASAAATDRAVKLHYVIMLYYILLLLLLPSSILSSIIMMIYFI